MTDDQHGDRHSEGTPRSGGRWDPLPQGDYDDGATAFVKLPEGGIDALLSSSDSPLAAPGHGYVPPQITVSPATTAGTDPAATGSWSVPGAPVDGTQWHDQHDQHGGRQPSGPQHAGQQDGFGYHPGDTGQWSFEEASAAENAGGEAAGQDVTGQWSIPVANGDLPDESGEFTTSALVEQWGGTPPATLPGGAPAPWATTQSIGRPWGPGVPGVPQHPEDAPAEHARGADPAHAQGARDQDGQEGQGGQESGHLESSAQPAQPVPPGAAGPEESAHTGPRSSGEPRQFADDAYPAPGAEPDGSTGAEARGERGERPEGARDEHREHPHPGAPDADRHAAGPGDDRAAAQDARTPSRTAGTPTDPSVSGTEGADANADADAMDAAGDSGAPRATEAGASATDTPAPGTPAAGDETAPAAPSTPAAPDDPSPPGLAHDDHPLASYVLRVNGTDRPVSDAWIGESLLYVLRERLGLAGSKDGCSQGECGSCNVQVDGRLVASCLVPAVTAAGSEVRTVEGLAQDGQPSDVQRALARCGAVQCGFCVPGMAMTVHDLLEGNPAPTELETRQALCGNLCRCSGYRGVVDAVKEVVAEREAHSASAGSDRSDQDTDEPRIPHQAGPGAGGVNPSAFQPRNDQSYGQDGGQA